MERFEGAYQMTFRTSALIETNEDIKKAKKMKLTVVDKHMKKPTRKDLVYLDDSPDYCERNQT